MSKFGQHIIDGTECNRYSSAVSGCSRPPQFLQIRFLKMKTIWLSRIGSQANEDRTWCHWYKNRHGYYRMPWIRHHAMDITTCHGYDRMPWIRQHAMDKTAYWKYQHRLTIGTIWQHTTKACSRYNSVRDGMSTSCKGYDSIKRMKQH